MTIPGTASLFDDDFDKDFSLVNVLGQSKSATKAELRFQRLVAKIERIREQLKQWQAYELRYNRRLASELEPLRTQLRMGERQMVELIDDVLSRPARGQRLGRVQRAKLRQLLLNLLTGLLQDDEDEALVALYDKYSDVSREELRQSEVAMTQSLLTDVFGLEVDDDHDASSAEELLQHAQHKLRERATAGPNQAEEGKEARATGRSGAGAARAQAAQIRREQAARETSQSLREVYRKLASALHPDREIDAVARQHKTLLMQRVNQAYDAGDLLSLLGLQLEIEQIDAAHLSSVPPQRLAHYNEILREQLAGLESELERCVRPFRHTTGWGASLTPAEVDRALSADIAQMQVAVRELQKDLVEFRDPVCLREMLGYYELEQDAGDPGDLAELMNLFQAPAPKRRGRNRRRR